MQGCKECEQKILEWMDLPLHSKKDKDLQRHIDECLPCRKFSRRMRHLKTKLHVMPKVEASPYFSTMLKQRIRKDYRRNQREIIPMILGFEHWVPIFGIIGVLFITGIWLINKRHSIAPPITSQADASELQYVLEEPFVMPASQNVQARDTLFQNVQAVESGMIPVSF
jgi:hypothetical protein